MNKAINETLSANRKAEKDTPVFNKSLRPRHQAISWTNERPSCSRNQRKEDFLDGSAPTWKHKSTLLEILDHAAEVESSMTETISLVQIQPIPPIFCHSNARGTPERSVKVEFTTRSTPQGRGGGALAQWPQKNYKSF